MPAPVAKRIPTVRRLHGEEVADDYAWLRDRSDPDVIAYLEAENAYTGEMMAPAADLVARLFAEIKGRIQETDLSVPARKDDYWYLTATEEGKQYRRWLCRHGGPDAPDRVLIDENDLAGGHEYFALTNFSVSPDHRIVAFATDVTGGERYTLRFRDAQTGADLPDEIPDTYYSIAWAADSETVFYTVPDEAMRPWQLWRHRLGTPRRDDVLVYQEDDERFFLWVMSSRSDEYVFIILEAKETTEVRFLRADRPEDRPGMLRARREGVRYQVAHHGDHFLIIDTEDAPDGRLLMAPVADPDAAIVVVDHVPGRKIDDVDAFSRHFVVWGRRDGLTTATIHPDGGEPHDLGFEESVYRITSDVNLEYDTDVLRFRYQSLVTPPTVYDQDLATGERQLRKQVPVLGGYDPERYATSREWAAGADGTPVPISLVMRRDTPRDGTAPLLLYGYGSYEHSVDPGFSAARLSLLDRGVIYAIAHVRGGGEMGRTWYEQGKMVRKANTFTDFIACAEHLVAAGYADPSRLAARGASAGGLLIGAVLNLRPDLFRALVAEVPFVDVVNTMLDDSLPLTITEWEEWGNPAIAEDYGWIRAYTPYENLAPGDRPSILVTAGLNDPRVAYWEPAKWVALLRATPGGDRPVLLKTEMGAGHSGPSGRYDAWRDEAFVMAFVLRELGVER